MHAAIRLGRLLVLIITYSADGAFDGSAMVGGVGGASSFVSAGGAGVVAGGEVSSCFTFFLALFVLFFPFFFALGKVLSHLTLDSEVLSDHRYTVVSKMKFELND